MHDERNSEPDGPSVLPDLSPLRLPEAEEALLRLLLAEGRTTTGDAARRLGLPGATVSRAASGLRARGYLLLGLPRGSGLVLGPLEGVLDALVEARREHEQTETGRLERLRDELLAVARWSVASASPHSLVGQDIREWERKLMLRRLRRSLEVIVDRNHVNTHVTGQLLSLPRRLGWGRVRLLVTGADDLRPTAVLSHATDLDAAAVGVEVRRLPQRCAAFALYDRERLEVPMWLVRDSGWSEEPGEVWAAGRLFDLLWNEAEPQSVARLSGRPFVPERLWPRVTATSAS